MAKLTRRTKHLMGLAVKLYNIRDFDKWVEENIAGSEKDFKDFPDEFNAEYAVGIFKETLNDMSTAWVPIWEDTQGDPWFDDDKWGIPASYVAEHLGFLIALVKAFPVIEQKLGDKAALLKSIRDNLSDALSSADGFNNLSDREYEQQFHYIKDEIEAVDALIDKL